MPLEPVGETVYMHVHANAYISVQNRHQREHDHRMIQNMREPTYPMRHISTKKPSLVLLQEASKARRQSSVHPSQARLAGAAQLSDISMFHVFLSVINSVEDEREVRGRTVS